MVQEVVEREGVGEREGGVGFAEVEVDAPDMGGWADRYMVGCEFFFFFLWLCGLRGWGCEFFRVLSRFRVLFLSLSLSFSLFLSLSLSLSLSPLSPLSLSFSFSSFSPLSLFLSLLSLSLSLCTGERETRNGEARDWME